MESAIIKDVSGCKEIQITLRITESCNRQCSYCHWHYGKHYKYQDIIKIIKILENKFKNKKLLFYIHGGEPTIHPDLKKILIFINKNKNNNIELQTNLDHISKFEILMKYIDLLDISFHYPLSKKDIEKRIKFIKKYKEKINTIDLIYIPEFETEIIYLKKILNNLKIKNEITYNFFESKSYENNLPIELKKLLNKNEIIKNKYFNKEIKIDICDTSNYIIINGDGEVYKCSHQLTKYPSSGNIIKNPNIIDKIMIKENCPYDYCGYEYEYLKDCL